MNTKQVKTKRSRATKPRKAAASKQRKGSEKLSDMKVLDGKLNEQEEETRSLETLLNPDGLHNPFKTSSPEKLESNMIDMSLPELQSLAVEVGVFPSGNRTTLKNKLKKEFKSRTVHGKDKIITTNEPIVDPNSLTEEQKKLFSL